MGSRWTQKGGSRRFNQEEAKCGLGLADRDE
jgi:hypothetical protein